MTRRPDSRIPLVFGSLSDLTPADAALIEGDAPAPPHAVARFDADEGRHAAGCACCRPRLGAAEALATLFLARARSRQAWFERVVVIAASRDGRDDVLQALADDAIAAARFRLDEPSAPDPARPPVPANAA